MGLLKTFFTNCACPQGRMGRAMLKFMNLCHAPLTNWYSGRVDDARYRLWWRCHLAFHRDSAV